MTLNNLGVALEGQSKIKDAALAYKAAVLIDPSLEIAKVNAKNAIHQYVHIGGGALLSSCGSSPNLDQWGTLQGNPS